MKAILLLLLSLFVILLIILHPCESFQNLHSDSNYPCRTFLSDVDFLKHMITHHQVAIDMSIEHIKHTKNVILMKVLRELIWTQNYEIMIMEEELKHKTENVSRIHTNQQAYTPAVSSYVYPNVIGISNAYCDPTFFGSHGKHTVITDKEYILHMIPHHQVAVDMCKILLKHTKSDFLIYLAYRMIRAQEAEIILLNDLLKAT